MTTAQVILGRDTFEVSELVFRSLKRALPMLNRMAPRLSSGQLTEADFDDCLAIVHMAIVSPPVTLEALNGLPIRAEQLTQALMDVARLSGLQGSEPSGPNVPPATGGAGTTSTPT